MQKRYKFCDSTRRPITKDLLLAYHRMGITYFCRVVEFIEDYSESEPHKWEGWNYTPGMVIIELLENTWNSEEKIVQRVLKVDSRMLTIVAGHLIR